MSAEDNGSMITFLCLERALSDDSAALAEARKVSKSIRGPVGSAFSRLRINFA